MHVFIDEINILCYCSPVVHSLARIGCILVDFGSDLVVGSIAFGSIAAAEGIVAESIASGNIAVGGTVVVGTCPAVAAAYSVGRLKFV
jgi:hypothetical protein